MHFSRALQTFIRAESQHKTIMVRWERLTSPLRISVYDLGIIGRDRHIFLWCAAATYHKNHQRNNKRQCRYHLRCINPANQRLLDTDEFEEEAHKRILYHIQQEEITSTELIPIAI